MDESTAAGRSTPATNGTNSKPNTPVPSPAPGNPSSSPGVSPLMVPSIPTSTPTSHGPNRYVGYPTPPPPPSSSHGQFGPPQSTSTSMANHIGSPSSGHHPHYMYGHPGHTGGSHPSGNGSQYMLPMMMPPPSQYPSNKPPPSVPTPHSSIPPHGSGGSLQQHVPLMNSERPYYSRLPGPPLSGHGGLSVPPQPSASPYYARSHPMQPQTSKPGHYYPNNIPPNYLPSGQMPSMMVNNNINPNSSPHHHPPPPSPHPNNSMHHYPPHLAHQQQHAYIPNDSGGSINNSIGSNSSGNNNNNSNSNASTHSNGHGIRAPQPPSILDEVSQTSTASSQAAEDSCASGDMGPSHNKTTTNKHHHSHPTTPNTSNLGSPGAASLSSFHDDFDSVSSPSWPRTPASPALNSSQFESHSHNHKRPDGIQKLFEMSDEPERKIFLDKYFQFLDERKTPLNQIPTISKIPVDLFRLYVSVKERGGFLDVTRGKLWKECAQLCNIAHSSSAAYTLRKQYMKHLLAFECKFDRGGIDPGPVLSSLENASTTNRKKSAAVANAKGSAASQQSNALSHHSPNESYPLHHPGYESLDQQQQQQHNNYPPNPSSSGSNPPYHPGYGSGVGEYGGPYGQGPPNAPPHMPPGMPPPSAGSSASQSNSSHQPSSGQSNHESISAKDPFSDEDQSAAIPGAGPSAAPSKGSMPNFPSRSHFSNINSYYMQAPPSSQAQQQPQPPPPPPPHANNYPESHHSQMHYMEQGQYPRTSSASTTDPVPANNSMPSFGPYRPAGVNGPSHYGPYGSYGPPPPLPGPPSSQYDASSNHPPPILGAPPGSHSRSFDHMQYPPPHHRYPIPTSHPPTNTVNTYSLNRSTPYPAPGQQPPAPPGPPPPGPLQHSHGTTVPSSQAGPPHPHPVPPSTPTPPTPYNNTPEGYNKPLDVYNTVKENNIRVDESPLAQRLLAQQSHKSQQQPTPQQLSTIPTHQQAYPGSQGYSGPPPPPNTTSAPGSGGRSSTSPTANATAGSAVPTTPQPPNQNQGKPPSSPSLQQSTSSAPTANTNISWASNTTRYPQPKRHPDFVKQSPDSAYPAYTGQPPYGGFSNSSSNVSPRPINQTGPSGPGIWNREGHFNRMPNPGSYMPNHSSFTNSSNHSGPPPNQSREVWHESRSSNTASGPPLPLEPSIPNHRWSPNRYPGSYPEYGGAQSSHFSPNSQHKMGHYGVRSVDQARDPIRLNHVAPPIHSQSGSSGSSLNKMPPGSPVNSFGFYTHSSSMMHGAQSAIAALRHESPFPPNTVEATVPTPSKRRKLTARDIPSVEAWRVYMALKSGLLAESTYALDVLNIYANDDNTLIYLALSNMPGLLEVLIEHYKRYLNEIFDNVFQDTEIGYEDRQLLQCTNYDDTENKVNQNRKLKWYELPKDYEHHINNDKSNTEDEDIEKFLAKQFKLKNNQQSKQIVLVNSTNYTNVTRTGKPVKHKRDKNLFIMDFDKKWDSSKNGFLSCGYEHWAKGGSETTSYIQTHMEPKENCLRFCRVISDPKSNDSPSLATNGFDQKLTDQPFSDQNNVTNDAIQNGNNDDENKDSSTLAVSDSSNNDLFDMKRKDFENGDIVSEQTEFPKIRQCDQERYLKRNRQPDYEEESYDQEEPAVGSGRDYQESIKSRCLTVSNLIRNLTFVPGNDLEMCRHPGLLLVLSRLIMLHHVHAIKKKRQLTKVDCTKISANRIDDEMLFNLIEDPEESKSNNTKNENSENESETDEKCWWFDTLHLIRENTLVTLANISGNLDVSSFPEPITMAILDGLLHWAVCPSSYAQDALPSAHPTLSPKRLAYETLSKLSINESNVDLILATPPWSRIDRLIRNLCRSLVRSEDQTIREFAIVLLSNFSFADPLVTRTIAMSGPTVSLLAGFIEQAEQIALNVATQHGIQYLRENFDSIGTTPDMIRRCALTLRNLARMVENRSLFVQHEQRFLSLGMSQIMDPQTSSILADILYELSLNSSSLSSSSSSASSTISSTSSSSLSLSSSFSSSLPATTTTATSHTSSITVSTNTISSSTTARTTNGGNNTNNHHQNEIAVH